MRSRTSRSQTVSAGLLAMIATLSHAIAEPSPDIPERPPQSAAAEPQGDFPVSIRSSLGAFGDPGGLRAALGARGINLTFLATHEVLGNPSGGVRSGAIHAGKLEGILTVDLGRLAGLDGVTAFANAFRIHDTGGLRDRSFQRLVTVSNIEAYPTTRLSELWLERRWDSGFAVRIGQLAADGEFLASETGKPFLSNDWPTITGANLPSGGPAYPLATPGVRLRYDPNADLSALVTVFNGDPGDQRVVNRHGTNFRTGDPPLVMAEIQLRRHQEPESRELAASLKFGGYRHSGRFDHLRFGADGQRLADPSSTGTARRLRGTSGLYVVADQQLYRPERGGPSSGVSIYARLSGSPSDRNLIDLWADGGVVVAGLVPGRPDDLFGASFIYARISSAARAFDRDRAAFGGSPPIRTAEATVELSYQMQLVPGWTLQPDLQYVHNPGGGTEHPLHPDKRITGGFVLGLRSTVVY
ncbi:carbohydrate porin [Methylobacterium sp. J-090]|uniref:carbohydrate porin n=1 Tax=Methylobacterium sp. J-090 TaxID=2836666 RepID=UPI001FBA5855|nr:carbohydrate porin [Methylobacterium sp. J-090]MCJ2083157.1 carbohydrate porin [Methylobacterium sp. J-090]